MVELPVDVLFAIIEEIGMQRKPDFDLLWALCSTCRTLRPHAQKFLFRSLSLEFTTSTSRRLESAMGIFWEHMEFILEGNPYIGVFVTYVRFRAELSRSISPRFATLLSKFTNLKTLRCGYEEDEGVSWDELLDSEIQIWQDILQLPSVQKLQLLRFEDIPVSALFPCTSLQTLYLDKSASFSPSDLQEHIEILPDLPLTNVVSVQTNNYFSALDPIFTVHSPIGVPMVERCHVKHLSAKWIDDDECHKIKDFSSLRSFDVDLSIIQEPRNLFANLHPSSVQSLRSFTMQIDWDSKTVETYPEMPLLMAAMDIHPIFPNLTKVSVTVSFLRNKFKIEEPLAELDQLFASTTKFPRLRTVTIKLNARTKSAKEELIRFWVQDSGNINRCLPVVAARSKCKLVPHVGL